MRVLDSAALAALDAGRFHARNGFAVDMPAGVFALWDDAYDVTVGGTTYARGAGAFTIAAIPSTGDMAVHSVDITLSGIDSNIAAQVLSEPYHQRPVTVSRFIMAAEAPTVIYAKVWFTGFVDTIEWTERPGGASALVAKCEDIDRELGRKDARTRSPTDQKQLFAGDLFFDHVTAAVNTDTVWGRIRSQPAEPRRRKLFGIF